MAEITFTIDGKEVSAPEGLMLVDGAKLGDIEIPVFCYQPKLGPPVGACRMCLVEIEGMPKLQTACSTPVRDGMVVFTQSDRVKEAQNAIIEFLLANHPLDCPVCDKGGECPLQDNTMGWGRGTSRFNEPKRRFPKPVKLSPLINIDRERCILCYRCVRFSQEVSEDYQLTFQGRGDHTHVGTFDDRPYVAPFSGNIIELCPVGALTSIPYRFKARPWDIESSESVCALCPSQCNIHFTVRDDRVMRVLARDNPEVDNGWLCDKGRFAYQAANSKERLTAPLERVHGQLVKTTWERATERVADGLRDAGDRAGALVGGSTSNEEGFLLQKIFRDALGSPHIDSRRNGHTHPDVLRLLARPELQAAASDIDGSDAILAIEIDPVHQAPIIDLRIRKAVRRNHAHLILAVSRRTALDPNATHRLSCAPGSTEALLLALIKAVLESAGGGADGEPDEQPTDVDGAGLVAEGLEQHSVEELAELADASTGTAPLIADASTDAAAGGPNAMDTPAETSTHAGVDRAVASDTVAGEIRAAASILTKARAPVIVFSERLGHNLRGTEALKALANLALILGLHRRERAGLLEISEGTNGRGLKEVGCLPNLAPGLADPPSLGMSTDEIRDAAESGEINALYLLHIDPLRDLPSRHSWEEALGKAGFVVCQEEFLSQSALRYADIVLPAESYAEKEGTLTHPDGRLQRLRPAVGHPGEVRMEWQVLIDLAGILGLELGWVTLGQVQRAVAKTVPFYEGLTLEEIGGRGVRWQDRPAASKAPATPFSCLKPELPPAPERAGMPRAQLATYPLVWSSTETEHAPALEFLSPRQAAEMAPSLAEKLGVTDGDIVELGVNGQKLLAPVVCRERLHRGTVYLVEGASDQPANSVAGHGPQTVEIGKAKR